ncbi:MAG: hypothetical protein LBN07_02020 [Christensenellaceae bacterium]|jgi:hypothetical protein|nr:hypothetical protein [Christensenellaceae bacterium]
MNNNEIQTQFTKIKSLLAEIENSQEIQKHLDILYKYIFSNLSIKSMLPAPFDFNYLVGQIRKCYNSADCAFTLEEVISIFDYFIKQHETKFGIGKHPRMKNQTIKNILQAFGTCTQTDGCEREIEHTLEPDDYYPIIDKFFELKIDGNYAIALFMSGDFRGNLFFKIGGG